ncbi:MAG: hypothetical protein MJZ07_07780 [Bacteroidales bacterium]|nr:hypothetical protein [Bacteroidales bacterium]
MKKWVRNLLKGTSLSTALFIFQACYGMPPGYDPMEIGLVFQVVDADDNQPLEGVGLKARIKGGEWEEINQTDRWGVVTYIDLDEESADFQFSAENYKVKDTSLTDLSSRSILIKMQKTE